MADLQYASVPLCNLRDCQLEGIVRMSVLLAQRPHDLLVNLLRIDACLFRNLGDDGIDGFTLFVLLLALSNFFSGYTSF